MCLVNKLTKEVAKERCNASIKIKEQNKVCEKCFYSQCSAPNALNVATNLLVCSCLLDFWWTWAHLGAYPRLVSILKDGYVLPLKIRPLLVREPLIIIGYANPPRNSYLEEDLHSLIEQR